MTDPSPLEDLRDRVPSLQGQLTKWVIRVVIAYVLARNPDLAGRARLADVCRLIYVRHLAGHVDRAFGSMVR